MKRKLTLSLTGRLMAGLLFFFGFSTQTAAQFVASDVHPNVLRVKLTEESVVRMNASAMQLSSNGILQTSLQSINPILETCSAYQMKRLFPFSAKHDHKHRKHGLHLWYVIRYRDGVSPKKIAAQFGRLDGVLHSEPVYKKRFIDGYDPSKSQVRLQEPSQTIPASASNDTFLDRQWHYNNTGEIGGIAGADISLFEAWDSEMGKPNVVVAITDGGVQSDHQDLAANIWVNEAEMNGTEGVDDDNNGYVDDIHGYNFAQGKGEIEPGTHGTHVGGTVSAVTGNGIGVAGVAGGDGSGNGVRLMSLQMFSSTGNADPAPAYVYAADNGAVISQNSWGYTSSGVFGQAVKEGIDYFIAEAGDFEGSPMKGGIVIFSSGNNGEKNTERYPGYYAPTLAVASTDIFDARAPYSNFGDYVDISAPGGDTNPGAQFGVLSTVPDNQYGFMQGTSMACPHVSGVAGLILSKYGSETYTPEELKARLFASADNIDDFLDPNSIGAMGIGRLNAFKALEANDGVGPVAIADLAAKEVYAQSVLLSWTAPVDEQSGSPSGYKVYYSEEELTGENYQNADNVEFSDKTVAGEMVEKEIDGLVPDKMYYAAVVAYDLWKNTSEVSNIISFTMLSTGKIAISPEAVNMDVDVAESPVASEAMLVSNLEDYPLNWKAKFVLGSNESSSLMSHSPFSIPENPVQTALAKSGLTAAPSSAAVEQSNVEFSKQLKYDPDLAPDEFVGTSGSNRVSASARFDLTEDFFLTHISDFYRNNGNNAEVFVEVYRGGNLPDEGVKLTSQTYSTNHQSDEGSWEHIELLEPQQFKAGETMWLIVSYPEANEYPIAVNKGVSGILDKIFLRVNEGEWQKIEGVFESTVVKLRASSAEGVNNLNFLTITPESGSFEGIGEQAVALEVNASNTYNGEYTGYIMIESTDTENPEINIPFTLNVSGQKPMAALSPSFLEFTPVFVGNASEQNFMIKNKGYADLEFASVATTDSQFEVISELGSIAPGQEKKVTVRFQAQGVGNHQAELKMETNAGSLSVLMIGVGIDPPVLELPEEVVHSGVNAGETVQVPFMIRNTGAYPMHFSFPGMAAAHLLSNPNIQKNNTARLEGLPSFEKGQADTRAGHPVVLGAGSDADGTYTWIDSNEEGGPIYIWNDISEAGQKLDLSDEDSETVDLGFDFKYYGKTYTQVRVSANGYLSFDETLPAFTYTNDQIPDADEPNALIAGLWDDFIPGAAPEEGGVFAKSYGSHLVVQFEQVPHYLHGGSNTFQMVISVTGQIAFYYKEVEENLSATIGIENEMGKKGAQVAFNTDYVESGLAVLFGYNPQFITNVTPLAGGVVPAGGEYEVTVDLSAEGLNEGTYHNTLAVASSDPFSPVDEVAFELEVTGSGNYVITDDEIDFGELFVGLSKVASATLKNNGTKAIVMDLMEAPTNPCVSFDWDGERTVLPGESVELAFKYTPTAPEEYEEEIKFSTDVEGMEELVLTLKGKAVNPPVIAISPDRLISYVKAEDVVNLGIMVSNQGEADLEYRIPATFWSKPGEPPVRSLNAYQRMRAPDSAPAELQSDEPTQPVAVFDDYGYSWSTSEMKSSRSYEWMDISAAPDLGIVTDGAVKVGLPFDFEFYGAAYDSLYIAGNGFVSFIEGGFATGTIEIPNPNVPNAIIAPYKKLLDPSSSGTIHYYPGNDFVIVQWQEVEEYSFFGSGGLLTFQVILYKDGTIKFQYKSVEEGVASNHVIGIENAEGIDGLQISRNNSEFISDEMAITVDVPQRGIVPAGETKEVMVTVDAAYLTDGVYYDTLSVFSNDVVMPEYEIPLKLDVKGMPKPAFYGSLSFGEVYAYTDEGGEAKSYSKYFSIKNEGSKVDHVMPLKVGTLSGGSIAGVTERTVFKVDGVEIGTEPIALQPDQSVTVELVFTPDPELSEAFDFSGYAIVKGDEPEGAGNAYYGVACSGSVMPAPEMQLKYDDLSAVLMPGETKEQTVKVLNNGKGLLQYKFRPKFGDLTIQKQLKYDSEPVTTSFIGLGNTGSKVILATKFVAPEGGFTLTHINNYYRSETLENYGYDMTVYRGGDNPTAGELVQTVSHVNEQAVEGDWAMTEMTEAVDFEEGEVFWIVIDYQLGTEYPQGRDTGVSGMEGIHKYSVDGGTSWKPLESDLPGTALKVRALSGYYSDEWLTVSDAVGTVQAGDSVELTVTFIADLAPVEENQVDVEVTSNDPMQQMLNIPASLTVNSAPAWVDPIEQSEIAEGETVTAFFRAVDKSALIYRIEGEKPNLGLEQSANGLELTFSPSFDMAGEHTFTMVAEDSYGATSSHTWTVNVQNVNRSPKAIAELERRIYLLDDKELSSESFKFKDLFADPDKTPFAGDYSLTDPSVAQVAVSETGFVLQPVAEGLAMVTLQGSDPEGEAASVSFEIEVRATNKAPQVAQPIGPRSVDFDKELSIDVSQLFADAEGDAFELSFAVSDESLVRTTLSNGVLHFAPLAEEGSVNVQLLAKDWKSSSTEEFTLKIVPNTVPELVSSISDLELNVPDQAKWLQLSSLFEDKDGDALTYAAEVENEGIVTINYQDGRLQLVPVASGVTTVTLTVSDGRGGVTTQQFRVSVSYRILEAGADALELGVYPNPMSDQGTLSYRIPEAGDVEIRIMSVTGKIVRIMNLGEQAEGSHTVALNRETLVKGMYMIQLVVDGKSQEVVRMFVK